MAETRNASKSPVDASEAVSLLGGATDVYVAKPRKFLHFDLAAEGGASHDEVAAQIVSRWGRLRAPALRVGSILAVGFNEEMLTEVVGDQFLAARVPPRENPRVQERG